METLTQEDEVLKGKYPLFSVVGIEVEFMIVDAKTLNILPIAEIPLQKQRARVVDEITWNNELAAHVIELNLTCPTSKFKGVDESFHGSIKKILQELKAHGAKLLPGGIHPWMNPAEETRLWVYENKEIYEGFHQIFDCHRHGWANLQSIHLNLPFETEEDFRKLHSSLRVLLPIIPALTASSPFADGINTGFYDYRLEVYTSNSNKHPVITGDVIPDVIKDYADLKKNIYEPIQKELAQYNKEEILDPVWVNSRGLLPRFDRGSIEMRIIDSQECSKADVAVAEAIFLTGKALTNNQWQTQKYYESISTKELVEVFKNCIKHGEDAMIDDLKFLSCFGIKKPVLAKEIWYKIADEVLKGKMAYEQPFQEILKRGTLAKKLVREYRKAGQLLPIYEQLAFSLEHNQLWS